MEKTAGNNYPLVENLPSRKANSSTASIALSETQDKEHQPPKSTMHALKGARDFVQTGKFIKFAPLLS